MKSAISLTWSVVLGVLWVLTLTPMVHSSGICGHCRLDICFVVDESGSVADHWDDMKDLMHDIVSELEIGPTATRIGVVKFNTVGSLVFNLKAYFDQSVVLAQIGGLAQSGGGSNMATGINIARTDCFGTVNGDREDAQNVMMVISDGMTTHYPDAVYAARAARGDGIAVIAIAVGEDPNELLMINHIGYIDKYTFFVDDTTGDYTYDTAPEAVTSLLLTFCKSECMANVCFVVDESGALPNDWDPWKQMMKDFISIQTIGFAGTLVGVVEMDMTGHLTFNMVEHLTPDDLNIAIDTMVKSSLALNLAAGIDFARTTCFGAGNGARSNARNVMIVITDGKTNFPEDPVAAADAARADGITVIAIGVRNPNIPMIEAVAGSPQYSLYADDFSTIVYELDAIYGELCRTICRVDMCFVVDESGGIGLANFENIKTFMSEFVEDINIGNHDNLVGVVEFNHDANPTFDLDDCDTKAALLACIDAMIFGSGATDIGDGILEARTYCFGPGSGNRPFAPNVMFVVTDGATTNVLHAQNQADEARTDGTTVVTIGVLTPFYNPGMLDDIAGGVTENKFQVNPADPADWDDLRVDVLHWYNKHWCCRVYCIARDPFSVPLPLRTFYGMDIPLPLVQTELLTYNPSSECRFKVIWDRSPSGFNFKWMSISVGKDPDIAASFYREIELSKHPMIVDEPTQIGWNCPGVACPPAAPWPRLPWYPYKVEKADTILTTVHELVENVYYEVRISPEVVEADCPGEDDNPDYRMSYLFPSGFGVKMVLSIDWDFYDKHKAELTGFCVDLPIWP